MTHISSIRVSQTLSREPHSHTSSHTNQILPSIKKIFFFKPLDKKSAWLTSEGETNETVSKVVKTEYLN